MASAWEGAARGLESGFRLGMDMHTQQRRDEIAARSEARQAGLDARAVAQQDLQNRRQATHDQRGVNTRRHADLKARASVYDENTPAATLDAFNNESEALRESEAALDAATMNPGAAQQGQQAGSPAATVKQIVRSARVPAEYFVRKNGQPSVVDQVVQAQMGDDPAAKINGWNALLHQDLQVGVGQAGAHGGTIVRKDIDSLIPDPADPQGRVIPNLKVWYKGTQPMDGMGPDAPPGATGFYIAPMTEGRSADRKADDKVKSVSIKDSMARLDALMQAAELINDTPEGQQGFAELMAQGGTDPVARFKAERARYGVPDEPKTKTTSQIIPAGASVRETTTDTRTGKVVRQETTAGPAKTVRAGTSQEKADAIDAMVEDGTLTEAEGIARKRVLASTITEPKKGRGGLDARGGALGAGSDGDGLSTPQKRKRDADRNEAKDRFDRADKNADNAEKAVDTARIKLRDLDARVNSPFYATKDGGKADTAMRTELEAEIKAKDALAETARVRASSLSADLDKPEEAPAPARKFDKDGKATGPAVLKYDKNGNRKSS